jgi:hypothetical protein
MHLPQLRGLVGVGVALAIAGCGNGGGRRPAESTKHPPTTTRFAKGPLVDHNAGNFYFVYTGKSRGDVATIAAVTVTNNGAAPVSLQSGSTLARSGLDLVGIRVVDNNEMSPGEYNGYPPEGFNPPSPHFRFYEPSQYPLLRHGQSALVLAALRLRGRVGSIAAVTLTYRVGNREYTSVYSEPTVLCPGEETARECASETARARAVKTS